MNERIEELHFKMKYYTISFPGEFDQYVRETWSEDQIIESYYTYWSTKMIEAGRGDDISKEKCIEDWRVVHYAWATDELGRLSYGDCDCGCNDPVADTPQQMLEFLANRFTYGAVADGVADIYARDIRKILKDHYGIDN